MDDFLSPVVSLGIFCWRITYCLTALVTAALGVPVSLLICRMESPSFDRCFMYLFRVNRSKCWKSDGDRQDVSARIIFSASVSRSRLPELCSRHFSGAFLHKKSRHAE